jgi:hypothetical protein
MRDSEQLDEIALSVAKAVVDTYNDLTEVAFPEYAEHVIEGDIEDLIVEWAPDEFGLQKPEASLIASPIKRRLGIILLGFSYVTIDISRARRKLRSRALETADAAA